MRVLVVSDIHSNLVALETVLADCPEYDALWNLGDTIGYGPNPRECIDRLVGIPASPSLVGNHDLACIGEIDAAEFNPVAQAAVRWTAGQLAVEHRAHLQKLPASTIERGITLAHGSPRSPVWEYVTSAAVATANFACLQTDVCLVGHSHIAMIAQLRPGSTAPEFQPLRPGQPIDLTAGRFIVNPGSVGQPRDRDPRAAYAVLDTDRYVVTGHRVDYDISATQRRMTVAGLPEALISRLSHGA